MALLKEDLADLALELIEHLNWIGWGDAWEREASEELRWRVDKLLLEIQEAR